MQKEEKNKSSGNYSTVSFIWYLEVIARLGWPWRSSPFDTHVLGRSPPQWVRLTSVTTKIL